MAVFVTLFPAGEYIASKLYYYSAEMSMILGVEFLIEQTIICGE